MARGFARIRQGNRVYFYGEIATPTVVKVKRIPWGNPCLKRNPRQPAVLLRFLRLLQFLPQALGNRPHDTGRRSLWSRRTTHHRSAPGPSRSSSGSSRTLRSRNATTSRFAASGLDQPAAGENDAPGCRWSHSRGVAHTWGTPFFCFTQRDLDRSRRGPRRRHESPDANRGSLNAARGCLNVVDTFRA